VLNRIKIEFYWVYSAEYYVSSTQHCTLTYAQHFYKKHMFPIDEIAELLGEIAPNKKISFDKNYTNAIYKSYITKDVDDS